MGAVSFSKADGFNSADFCGREGGYLSWTCFGGRDGGEAGKLTQRT